MTSRTPPPPRERQRITRELLFAAFVGPSTETDDPRILERMSSAVEEESLEAGDFLYREGDEALHVHFMSEGRMRLTRNGAPDWVYEGRWVVGTTDVLAGRPRARSAVMETSAQLFRLPSERWFEVMYDRPEVLLSALRGFSRGNADLYARLPPDGAFRPGPPARCDVSTLAGRARLLASQRLLRGVSMQVLVELANMAEVVELAPDEPVFGGGLADNVVVVTQGSVEVSRSEPDVRATFSAGSIAGHALCMGEIERAWSARAVERAEVLAFPSEALFDLLEDHVDGVRAMMTAFALERERLCDELAGRLGELVLK